ncbi:hypothetical protein ACQKOF_24875 [Lysinibacillus sp. NPDC093190]|uniref:hypothetical protein n=1 Tax=Lysinibacillus sp. NPDC093190 TaxID=3390575 RepID=UPI003D0570AE
MQQIEKILSEVGFNVTKNNGINQTWNHSDGSEVRIHAYGNKNAATYKSANNAHVHKQDLSNNQLNDRGAISTNKNETREAYLYSRNMKTHVYGIIPCTCVFSCFDLLLSLLISERLQ